MFFPTKVGEVPFRATSESQKKLIDHINNNSEFKEVDIGGKDNLLYRSAKTIVKNFPDHFEIDLSEISKARCAIGKSYGLTYVLRYKGSVYAETN